MVPLVAILLVAPFAFLGSPAPAQSTEQPKRLIRLSLEATNKTVRSGEVPKFELTIRNEGNSPQRILDLSDGRRSDLQDSYYSLEVRRGGRAVDIPRQISDPGPIGENDFLTLKPGETVTFELTRFAVVLERLLPGKYQARIRFWQDPFQPGKSAFFSPYADFTVRD